MKHFLKILWSFVLRLPKQVTQLIKMNTQTSATPKHQIKEIAKSKLLKRKIKKRLKTFKSFLREEGQARQLSNRRRKRFERKRRSNRIIRSSIINSSSVQNLQSLEQEHNKESFTNEVEQRNIQIELAHPVVFQDMNGFEISIILPEVDSPEKVEKEAADSDEQLLHLICGDKEQSKNTNLQQISHKRVFCKRKCPQYQQQNSKKQPIYNSQKQKTIKYTFNPEDESLLSQQASRLPLGDRKKLKYKRQLKQEKNRLKVINLVDLVNNQDNPPLYQIPLYVEQSK